MKGVISTRVGYSGGTSPHPTYHNIGDHSESIKISYDETIISYPQLLAFFINLISPFERPYSTQYKTILFYQTEEEKRTGEAFIRDLSQNRQVFIESKKYETFYDAEFYHQKYMLQKYLEISSYLIQKYGGIEEFYTSEEACRISSIIVGHYSVEEVKNICYSFQIPEPIKDKLIRIHSRMSPFDKTL